MEGANESERVLFVNRISPEKGLHVLLDAFERVVARRPNATLEIVGSDNVIPLEAVTSLNDILAVCRLERFYKGDYPKRRLSKADACARKWCSGRSSKVRGSDSSLSID